MANRPQPIGPSSSAEVRESELGPGHENNDESNTAEVVGERDEQNQQDEEEEEEVEKLESEVKEMAQKLLDYRATLPDQLKSALASLLTAQRPELPSFASASEPGPSNTGNSGDSSAGVPTITEDEEVSAKLKLIKEKISSNAAAMPIVSKRMNDCISRIDRISSDDDIIHPAFKRKKS